MRAVKTYWALAITRFQQEERAASHVEKQGFTYWLPRMAMFTLRGAERRSWMFSGYLFFQVRAGWEAVCSTKGIASVFLCDGLPSRVRQDEFEYLRGLEDDRGLVVLPPRFNDGDSVRVVKGSYSGVVGMVQGMSVAGRLSVLWSMFGKEVTLNVNESSLEIA